MRGAWVFRDGALVEKRDAAIQDAISTLKSRSDLPCPMIMSDIGDYRSMVDGSMISGRKQHRDHLRAHGCIEVGNEMRPGVPVGKPTVSSADIAQDVKAAIEQVKAGYVAPDSLVGQIDEDGVTIEMPEIDTRVDGVVPNGSYVRSEAKTKQV